MIQLSSNSLNYSNSIGVGGTVGVQEAGFSCLGDRPGEEKEKYKMIPRYLCPYYDPYNCSSWFLSILGCLNR